VDVSLRTSIRVSDTRILDYRQPTFYGGHEYADWMDRRHTGHRRRYILTRLKGNMAKCASAISNPTKPEELENWLAGTTLFRLYHTAQPVVQYKRQLVN
jgi:hypothetical protein